MKLVILWWKQKGNLPFNIRSKEVVHAYVWGGLWGHNKEDNINLEKIQKVLKGFVAGFG
jgi:hypothetical protein